MMKHLLDLSVRRDQANQELRRCRITYRNILYGTVFVALCWIFALPMLLKTTPPRIHNMDNDHFKRQKLLIHSPKLLKVSKERPATKTSREDIIANLTFPLHARTANISEKSNNILPNDKIQSDYKSGKVDGASLTLDSMQEHGARLARPYHQWNYSYSTWCHSGPRHQKGLFYVKLPKAASSTCAGIARRIASRHKTRHSEPCAVQAMHIPDYRVPRIYGNRKRRSSFLWSSVRNPASRALSRVFFTMVSSEGWEPTDDTIETSLRAIDDSQYGAVSPGKGGFQLAYLSTEPIEKFSMWHLKEPTMVLNASYGEKLVQGIVDDYDFLLVVERMDESLVVLQLLLDLDPGDILYVSSKLSGGYFFSPKHDQCVEVQKSFVSKEVQKYLSSAEWYAKNYGDYLLVAAANKSLDMTIEMLGKDIFDRALQEFQRLKNLAEKTCRPHAVFPCSSDGNDQRNQSSIDCYHEDEGCGYRCLDKMLAKFTSVF